MAKVTVARGDSVIAFVCPHCPEAKFDTVGALIEHTAEKHEEGKWRR